MNYLLLIIYFIDNRLEVFDAILSIQYQIFETTTFIARLFHLRSDFRSTLRFFLEL